MERDALVNRIKEIMDAKGMKAYEVALKAGVRTNAIYSVLSPDKKKCPEVESLDVICKGMGISMSTLFEFASPDTTEVHVTEDEAAWLKMYRCSSEERIKALLAYYLVLAKGNNSSIENFDSIKDIIEACLKE